MNPTIEIRVGQETRELNLGSRPLTMGGSDTDLPLVGIRDPGAVAVLGLDGGQLFLQPTRDEPVLCNGAPVATSQWLYSGDVVRIGVNRVVVEISPERIRLLVQQPSSDNLTQPPSAARQEDQTRKRSDIKAY